MPPSPRWLKHVGRIREAVEASTVPFIDRATVETFFHLRRRQAGKLLADLDHVRVGNARIVPRQEMLRFLREHEADVTYRAEQGRHSRVRDALLEARRELVARDVRFAVTPAAKTIGGLPPTVSLQPGELRITFTTVEELLGQLFSLSQAIGSDFEAFQKQIDDALVPH